MDSSSTASSRSNVPTKREPPGTPGRLSTFARCPISIPSTRGSRCSITSRRSRSHQGRTALLQLEAAEDEPGFGLVGIYKDGPRFRARAVDLTGRERPEWAERVAARPLRTRRLSPELLVREPGWPATVRRLAERLEALEPYASPVIVAAVVVG